MPPYKSKSNKIKEKTIITLNDKHKEVLKNFYDEKQSKLPLINEKIYKLEENIKSDNISQEKIAQIKNKIQKLHAKKKALSNKKKKYYLKNSKYIFEYFKTNEEISKGINKKKSIKDFFTKKSIKPEQKLKFDSNNNKYLSNVDDSFLDMENYIKSNNVCEKCKIGELIPIENEGIVVCKNCSIIEPLLIENEKPSYKEPPKEVCFYAYKRINHFREILAQFQAKETTQIPDHIIEAIKLQIKKERIDIKKLTNEKTKAILKILKFNKYYEHIPFIKNKLGIKPPIMSPELENKLCKLFMIIQAPYAKYCPVDRVNFLNYYYTIYKLCELLDQSQYLKHFPKLKDKGKRQEQDDIWKKICNELDWEFIPTV